MFESDNQWPGYKLDASSDPPTGGGGGGAGTPPSDPLPDGAGGDEAPLKDLPVDGGIDVPPSDPPTGGGGGRGPEAPPPSDPPTGGGGGG